MLEAVKPQAGLRVILVFLENGRSVGMKQDELNSVLNNENNEDEKQ